MLIRADAPPAPRRLGNLPPTLAWRGGGDGHLDLLDQTLLPSRVEILPCRSSAEVREAIRMLRVRGAPAIGVAAAYGLFLGVRPYSGQARQSALEALECVRVDLNSARPTAVNLSWALTRASRAAAAAPGDGAEICAALLAEAHKIAVEDVDVCASIGRFGADLVPDGGGVLTHCNAGALATVGLGTALAALYEAHARGKRFRVYADETRPLLQGARLTAYELGAAGLDVTVLCDNAAAHLLSSGAVQMVIVGADRIAANGDVANKIGTYSVALAAARHGVPFYVAAPRSTFDLTISDGSGIPIEHRGADEVRFGRGADIVAERAGCFNPAFDVTPAELLSGIVSECGLAKPVSEASILKFFPRKGLQR